jgi:uncharacterized protein (UPF0371 family)
VDHRTVERTDLLLRDLGVAPEDRCVVGPARQAADAARARGKGHEGVFSGAAIELADGRIVTGCNSPLMHASSSLVLNAVKLLAALPEPMHLLAPNVIESITNMKRGVLQRKNLSLNLEETLIALSVSAAGNPAAHMAMEKLSALRDCDVHLAHIPAPGDEAGLRRVGGDITSDPAFPSRDLFAS